MSEQDFERVDLGEKDLVLRLRSMPYQDGEAPAAIRARRSLKSLKRRDRWQCVELFLVGKDEVLAVGTSDG